MTRFDHEGAHVEQRSGGAGARLLRGALGAAGLAWVAGALAAVGVAERMAELVELGVQITVSALGIAMVLAVSGALVLARSKRRPVRVRVSEQRALELASAGGAAQLIAPAWIRGALHERDGVVVVETQGDVFRVDVGSAERADALLEALGQSASERRARIAWVAWGQRVAVFAAVSSIVSGVLALGALFGPPALAPALWWSELFVPWALVGWLALRAGVREVEIGADGLVVRAWPARERRYRLDELATREAALAVVPPGAPQASRIALERRLDEALAGLAARRDDAPLAALLARGDRSFDEWRAALARVREAGATLRDAAITPERIAARLADPTAPEDQRIGAALALLALDRDAAIPRIRAAADTSTSPELRTAPRASPGNRPLISHHLRARARARARARLFPSSLRPCASSHI